MHDGWYICPVCDQLIELMHAVSHILEEHPQSGVAYAIRAEADRAWVDSR